MKAHLIPLLAIVAMASARVAAQPVPAPDHSLPASALIAKGFPDRSWTLEDYETAVKALEALAQTDPLTLPRAGSPQSGTVFARLVAEDNLTILRRKGGDAQEAFGLAVRMLSGIKSMLDVYGDHSTPQSTFDSEIAAVMSFALDVNKDLMSMAEALFNAIPANDPQREARLAGYVKMRRGLASTVGGSLIMLTEQDLFRLETRLQLAGALERHLPALYPHLLPGDQKELPRLLEAIVAKAPEDALKQAIQRIRATPAKG